MTTTHKFPLQEAPDYSDLPPGRPPSNLEAMAARFSAAGGGQRKFPCDQEWNQDLEILSIRTVFSGFVFLCYFYFALYGRSWSSKYLRIRLKIRIINADLAMFTESIRCLFYTYKLNDYYDP